MSNLTKTVIIQNIRANKTINYLRIRQNGAVCAKKRASDAGGRIRTGIYSADFAPARSGRKTGAVLSERGGAMAIGIHNSTPVSNANYVKATNRNGGQGFAQAFQQSAEEQQKQQLNDKVTEILDEISGYATGIGEQVDFGLFHGYCSRLSAVLNEILENAYLFRSERVMDRSGRQRVFATIQVVDERLDRLGSEIMAGNSSRIEFISKVDEIRGLLTDLFS